VIVFLHLPGSVGNRTFAAFRKALGEGAVGWLGRNVGAGELGPGLSGRGYEFLGGPIRLKLADALPGVRLFTTVIDDPRLPALKAWRTATADPEDPHHAMAHTLSLGELVEEAHPLVARFDNILTRQLTPARRRASVADALEAIKTRPFLIGDAKRPKAYAEALTAALDLPAGALDHRVFRGMDDRVPGGQVAAALNKLHAMDMKLVERIAQLRPDGAAVVRTTPQNASTAG